VSRTMKQIMLEFLSTLKYRFPVFRYHWAYGHVKVDHQNCIHNNHILDRINLVPGALPG